MNSTKQEYFSKDDYRLISFSTKKQSPLIIVVRIFIIAFALAYAMGILVGWISK